MKKRNHFMILTPMLVIMAATLVSCGKDSVLVSTQNLWFGMGEGTKTIEVTANCNWTITRNDDADWYIITPMEDKKDGTISVTVEPLEDADYRGASFVVTSPGGHIRRTVFISQNKLDFDGMINKVFGVKYLEHWNTDFYGQIVEDSYKSYEFDPYDTTQGYLMFFYEDGTGVQRDRHIDTAAYYVFQYEYDVINQVLHISFETIDGSPEDYSPDVLTASDSLYRFMHEYKPNWWERVDMRKVGTIIPDGKFDYRQKAVKRKDRGPIFQF